MSGRLRTEPTVPSVDASAHDGQVARRRGGGRRRRPRLRFSVAALAVALLAGSTFLVVRDLGGADAGPDGYPQRIGFERPSDRLPARPGRLAATLYDNDFGNGRNLGVTATGRLWELPRGANLLSPSGTLLLTQRESRPLQLVVHDLSTGDRRAFDGISTRWMGNRSRAHWSQDENTILATFRETSPRTGFQPMVLDLVSGALTDVGRGEPAGFRSPSEAVTVRKLGGPNAEDGIVATTTDLSTGDSSEMALRLAGPWRGDPDAELVASVAPEGRTMLLIQAGSGDDTVRIFSMTDGRELAPRNISDWDGCSPTWLGHDPVLPTRTEVAGAAILTDDGSQSLVAVHHRLQSSCLQLAAAALEAGPNRALFGTSTHLLTWYWWQALIAGSLPLLGLAWLMGRWSRKHLNPW